MALRASDHSRCCPSNLCQLLERPNRTARLYLILSICYICLSQIKCSHKKSCIDIAILVAQPILRLVPSTRQLSAGSIGDAAGLRAMRNQSPSVAVLALSILKLGASDLTCFVSRTLIIYQSFTFITTSLRLRLRHVLGYGLKCFNTLPPLMARKVGPWQPE